MLFLLIILVTVGAILGDEEDGCKWDNIYEECTENSDINPYSVIVHAPKKEELLEKCPNALQYFECFTGKLKDCEEEESDYEYMKTGYDIAKELCDEDSELHQAYAAHAACYRTLEGDAETCYADAKDVYRANYALLGHFVPEDVDGDMIIIEAMCMIQSAYIACLSDKVLRTCGRAAYTTMTDTVSRSLGLSQYCSTDLKDILKTSLLDSLELDEETRDVYRHVFNSIQK